MLNNFEDDEFFEEIFNLLETYDYATALEKIDSIDSDDDKYPQAIFYKAVIYIKLGEKDKALNLLKESISKQFEVFGEDSFDFGEDYELFANLGFFAFNRDDYEMALLFFEASVELNINQKEVLSAMSLCYIGLDDVKKGLDALNKAIELYPDDYELYVCKAECYVHVDRIKEAIHYFNKSIKLNPDNPNAWVGKGDIFLNRGKENKALDCFNKAIKIDPDCNRAHVAKAKYYVLKNNYRKADKVLRNVREVEEDDLEFHITQGQVWLGLEKFNKAIKSFDKALLIEEDIGAVWAFKAIAYQLKGDYDNCQKCLNKADELDSDVLHMMKETLEGF